VVRKLYVSLDRADNVIEGGRPFAPGLKLYLFLVEAVEVGGAALFAVFEAVKKPGREMVDGTE
jgi:hypothetical protein